MKITGYNIYYKNEKELNDNENLCDEQKFSDYFYKKEKETLNCKILHKEYSLYPALRVMQKLSNSTENKELKSFGRIDFVVKYKKINYVVEVKYNEGSHSSFWEALKVVGYSKYFIFQTRMNNVKPAIFMPKESIKLEHEYICSELDIKLFDIIKTKDNTYTVKEHDSRPRW